MNVQVGTDAGAGDAGIPVARVDLSAWAPLCRDLHVRCPPGAELHTRARTVVGLFRELGEARVEQVGVWGGGGGR